MPPAASTFSRALFEAAWTVIVSFFVSSPSPSSLTSRRVFLIRPACGERLRGHLGAGLEAVEVADVQAQTFVRNGPIGIASFDVEPRSLPIRM